MSIPTGKGMFVWIVPRCGAPEAIAQQAADAGIRHVLVKIADGSTPYYGEWDNPTEYVAPLVSALTARGIEAWGWQYLRLDNPILEAQVACERMSETGCMGFIIDAEGECKYKTASGYMSALRAGLDEGVSVGLSSYRFPSLHRELHWAEFIRQSDFMMPQVYWMFAHNPGVQLRASYEEYRALAPSLPYVPTGAAYKERGWMPSGSEIQEFLDTCDALSFASVNFWEWYPAKYEVPRAWEIISGWHYTPPPPPERIRILVNDTNLRNAPVIVDSTVIGKARANRVWDVTGEVLDANGRKWYKLGPTAMVASWVVAPA